MSNLDLIRRAALNWLARRDYAELELIQKLKAKGHSSTDISAVMTELRKAGYINDQRFAEHYIRWRREKGMGPVRIQLELQARGVTEQIIAECLDITDNAWLIMARRVWQKHFKGHIPADFKGKAAQMRFMQYRGFTREQIHSVLDASLAE